MHIIQIAQEQHAIYFGYAFLGKFYRNRKGLKTSEMLVFYILEQSLQFMK